MTGRDLTSLLLGLVLLCHTWGAQANLEVNMEDRVEVFRGKTAQITCMFNSSEGIGGLLINMLYEKKSGERHKIYFQDSTTKQVVQGTPYSNRISVNGTAATRELVLTINDVQLEDEVGFICLIKSVTEGDGEGRTSLKVFESPNLPTIEATQKEISVHESDPAKIGICEVKNGFPMPKITWYRNKIPLQADRDGVIIEPRVTTESSGLLSVSSELRMKVTKANKDDKFYCEVTYLVPGETRMTESNYIDIKVLYPHTAASVWVESPKGKIKEGDMIELHCQGNGNSPSSIITIKYEDDNKTWEKGEVMLENVTRSDTGVYKCEITDTDTWTAKEANTSVFVNYLDPAVVMPGAAADVSQGDELRATCDAPSSLQTDTVWFKNGEKVSKGRRLILSSVTYDMAGTYECLVTVPEIEGMETRGTLLLNVQGRPEIRGRNNTEIEGNLESTVNLSCKVIGVPTPSVAWTTADGKVFEATSQKETERGIESTLSLKVTSDITVFCKAVNSFGNETLAFNIKAIKPTPKPTNSPASSPAKGGSGVIVAVIIICILLLAILGSVLYFLYKKGKICGRSGKQDFTKEKSTKDSIVVEMKSNSTEDTVLLGVNGEKQPPSD